ncbi:cobB [Symbiodinium natans]|uniref:CobB protein n=1 Tax=Symbiodinium natans TaxID=878477 RepID=A0A812JVX9_9DINO|nr:cobB [Symbiodinium natans]
MVKVGSGGSLEAGSSTGGSLFITADSIAPAFISGLATITGALAAARGGAGAEDTLLKFEALKNFNAKVQEVQKFSQQANDVRDSVALRVVEGAAGLPASAQAGRPSGQKCDKADGGRSPDCQNGGDGADRVNRRRAARVPQLTA